MASRAPIELTVEGDGLAALQRKLKAAEGGKLLNRELVKALKDAGKPLLAEARNAARAELPHSGGLAESVASAPMRVQVSAAKREPGVKIVVKGVGVSSTNRGRLRHPTYGHRDRWVTQAIKPGWFTDAMRASAPRVRPHLLAAMERTAQKIANA